MSPPDESVIHRLEKDIAMLSYRLDQAEKDIGGLGGKIERQQEEIGSIQRAQTSLEYMLERLGESINSKIEHLGTMIESEREGSKAILQAVKNLPEELQKKNSRATWQIWPAIPEFISLAG